MYKQPPQHIILPVSVPREPQDLPNNNMENENDFALLNIPSGLRDLLRIFSDKQAYILLQNLEYNYAIDLKESRQPPNFSIYNLFCKKLEILQKYFNSSLKKG